MTDTYVSKGERVHVGIEVGEHTLSPEQYLGDIRSHYDLETLDFVLLSMKPVEMRKSLFFEWAEFFAEHKIYFAFLYTQQRGAPQGKKSHLTKEIVHKIQEIAGEYFVGDMIGETGGHIAWPEGHKKSRGEKLPDQSYETMQQPKDMYVQYVRNLVEIDRSMGIQNVLAVEATAFSRYNFEAGVSYSFLDVNCGNSEKQIAFTRGASRGYNRDLWGCHIAHEWYGGYRQDDPLKYKRLKVAYQYAYLSGANFIYSESGDHEINSYGYQYPANHRFCQEYRNTWNEFADFVHGDNRPSGGPVVKVAFVHGNLDSYTGWGSATAWSQFNREEWSFGAAERSWKILREVRRSRGWFETDVFGEDDTSHAPAYGLYDVIPIETPLNQMEHYDTLIFAGWNTMTPDLYDKLKQYVEGGGHLVISAAHFNTSARRDGEITLLNNGALEELLGCRLTVGENRVNRGVKFNPESVVPYVLYPATRDLNCDPIYAAGFALYADVELCGASVSAFLTDTFRVECSAGDTPALIEHRVGRGAVTLFTSLDYPGASAVYPFYRAVVREILASGHRQSDIKVLASDKVAFSIYQKPCGGRKIYLLNTDYNVSAHVIVIAGVVRHELDIPSLSLHTISL